MIKVENIVTPSPEQWQAVVRGVRNPMNSWDKSDSDYLIEHAYWTDASYIVDSTGRTIYDTEDNYRPEDNHTKEDDERYERFDFSTPITSNGERYFMVGDKDLKLLTNLANAGDDHGKYLRQLFVWANITAPTFWWLQFDTYKVGVTSNSCSKMHRLLERPFEISDFYLTDVSTLKMEDNDVLYEGEDNEIVTVIEWVEPDEQIKALVKYLNRLRTEYFRVKDTDPNQAKEIWNAILERLPQSYMQKRTVCISFQALRHMVKGRWDHKLPIWRQVLEALLKPIPYAKELIVGNYGN